MPAGNAVSRYFDAGSHVALGGDLCVDRLFRFGLVIGCHVSRLTSVRRKCPRGIVFITFLGHVIWNFEGFAGHDQGGYTGGLQKTSRTSPDLVWAMHDWSTVQKPVSNPQWENCCQSLLKACGFFEGYRHQEVPERRRET